MIININTMEELTTQLWKCPSCHQQAKNQWDSEYIEEQGVCAICNDTKMDEIIEREQNK